MPREQRDRRLFERSRNRRTFLKSAGATAALAAVAGCLGDDEEEEPADEEDVTDLEAVLQDGFGEPGQMTDDGVVTIRFWPAWGGFYEDIIMDMIDEFEAQHDDIRIEANLLGDYRESRTAAFTNIDAGDPEDMPDIAHFDTNDFITARDTGWFQPVENIVDIDPDDLLEPAVATATLDGVWWALPFYISNVSMHYNADMIAEAGYDPDDPPRSLEEVREVGEACVDQGLADYAVTIPNDSWFVESWVSEQGELWLDNRNGHDAEPTTVFATEDHTMDVVEWWADLAADDLYFNAGIENWTDPESQFLDGNTPMNINSSTSVDWVDSDDFEVRTAQFPTLGGEGIGHSRGAAEMWVVNKERSEEEREALATFLEFITNAENQATFFKESGYYPAHTGSWEVLEDEGFLQDNPRYQVLREQIEAWEPHDTNQGLMTGENPAITDELTDQMNAIFGGSDPADAMATVKEEAEIALARYQRAEF